MTNPIDLVIYHGGCPDGIAGAWVFWRLLRKDLTKFHPGKFGESPPNVKNKHVLFVDFTYRKEETKALLEDAASITILDHHKTANDLVDIVDEKLLLILDMERSGAQLAWDYLEYTSDSTHVEKKIPHSVNRPWFINDIADRDLWKWQIPDSKFITRALFSMGYYDSLPRFNALTYKIKDEYYRSMLIPMGKILVKEDERLYETICRRALDCECISLKDPNTKWKVRLINVDHSQASDIGNLLVKDESCDFAAMWRYNVESDEWWISLRANVASTIDLTEVCKHFDKGGGHPKAAGITIFGKNGHSLRTVFKIISKSN